MGAALPQVEQARSTNETQGNDAYYKKNILVGLIV